MGKRRKCWKLSEYHTMEELKGETAIHHLKEEMKAPPCPPPPPPKKKHTTGTGSDVGLFLFFFCLLSFLCVFCRWHWATDRILVLGHVLPTRNGATPTQ